MRAVVARLCSVSRYHHLVHGTLLCTPLPASSLISGEQPMAVMINNWGYLRIKSGSFSVDSGAVSK